MKIAWLNFCPASWMTLCQGTVVRRVMPDDYAAFPDALTEFHAVDYAALGLANLGRPQGFIKRQVEGWNHRWRQAKLNENPNVAEIYRWLNEHLPASAYSTPVHNDYKLDNTMFAADDAAKLDWDMCTLGIHCRI